MRRIKKLMAGLNKFPRIFTAIIACVLATPIIFGKSLLFPFVAYRTYWFLALVAALVCVFFWSWSIDVRLMRHNPAYRALAIFLGIKLITDLAGLHPAASIFGNYERMMGWWLWVDIAAFAVILSLIARGAKDWKRLFALALVVGAAVTAYGLLQRAGIIARIRDVDPRLFSTVGNPGFLAGYLLLTFWLGLFAVKNSAGWKRAFGAGACILLLVGLAFTGTRGAFVGFIAGSVVGLGFYFLSRKSAANLSPPPNSGGTTKEESIPLSARGRIRLGGRGGGAEWVTFGSRARWIVAAALFCIIAVPSVWLISKSRLASDAASPIARLFIVSEDIGASRLRLWRAGLRAAPARWLAGYGENNIRLALDPYVSASADGERYDSTHNIFLDALLAHGAVGLLAFIWLLSTIAREWLKHSADDPASSAIALGAIASYIAQGFFLFDTLVALLPMSVIIAYTASRREGDETIARGKRAAPRRAIVVFMALASVYGMARSYQALSEVTEGYRILQNTADAPAAAKHFEAGIAQAFFGYGSLAGIMRDGALYIKAGGANTDEYLKVLSRAYSLASRFEGLTDAERKSIMVNK